MTCFSAERDMKVNTGHGAKLRYGRHSLLSLIFLFGYLAGHAQYPLHIRSVDKDSTILRSLQLDTSFRDKLACLEYISQLPQLLAKKGYGSAAVDSVHLDSLYATLLLYVGEKYAWGQLRVSGISATELQQTGLLLPKPAKQGFTGISLESMQKTLLGYLADHGYPFASVQLDSLDLHDGQIDGALVVEKGMAYRLDSIRVIGTAHISEQFLYRYLDMPQGSPYRIKSFDNISSRLRELPYLQESKPWAVRFGGNGAVLDLYLEPRKSSQINVLLGLLPGTTAEGANKFQVTGEATLNLKNALGAGETIGLNWQQLQAKSPRLNLLFQQPFLFGSPFGISAQFDLFKKDSSFLNVNTQLGLQYAFSARQTGKVFLQFFRSNLINIDTMKVINSRQLPPDIDMGIFNLGMDYEMYTTNYRRNPRRGWELYSSITAGTRKIRKSNVIQNLKSPDFSYASLYDTVKLNSYQFRMRARVARFLPIGRQAALQLLATAGWVQSPSLYRNELFQIGGYKLMRGFDEESIYASRYLVNTLEYRYLVGMNSYFFVFSDLGFTANANRQLNSSNRLLGFGFGMAFETTAGFFNLSLAAGKSNDTNFNLRQTKIHIGYVNYF